MIAKNARHVRIYATPRVDHLATPAKDLAPLCGQKLAPLNVWCRWNGDTPGVGVRTCQRCEALAGDN